ncbi:MAG: hypothetical protein HT580_13375 [Dechloromonas sp.]|nr:MAG: hypothetical protein HT580_13375 [Dechloromonas sp.]
MLEPAPDISLPTHYRQLALQGAAIVVVLSLAWPYFGWKAEPMPWRETAFAIGGVAFLSRRWPASPGHGVCFTAC